MKSLYNGLLAWGVAGCRVHHELFGPASELKAGTGKVAQNVAGDESVAGCSVTFEQSDVAVAWDPGVDNILKLAEAHGLRPVYHCRSGICHRCMCKLIAGEVNYVVPPADLPGPGCVLICCVTPKTEVIIGA